jgi:hypothetical protein
MFEDSAAVETSDGVESQGTSNEMESSAGGQQNLQEQGQAEGVEGALGNKALGTQASALKVVPSPYTPNFKFKVHGQEKEFDEWLKPIIKDAQLEKQVRQLYEKAYGLDYIKADREKFRNELDGVRTEHTSLKKNIEQLSGMVQKGDFRSFFEALKIPERSIFEYVKQRIDFLQKPEHEQTAFEKARAAEMAAESYQQRMQEMQQTYTTQATQQRTMELETYLSDPQLKNVADTFDQRMGKPGAFRNAVVQRGQYYAHFHGKDIPAHEAINEVLQMIGAIPPQASQPQEQMASTSPAPNQPGEQVQDEGGEAPQNNENLPAGPSGPARVAIVGQNAANKKPVIPNIQGRNTSPTRRVPKSIQDLRELAKTATD